MVPKAFRFITTSHSPSFSVYGSSGPLTNSACDSPPAEEINLHEVNARALLLRGMQHERKMHYVQRMARSSSSSSIAATTRDVKIPPGK
jgi:hypothetical protein